MDIIGSFFIMHMKTVVITNNNRSVWAQKMARLTGFPLIEVPYKRFADGEIELDSCDVTSLKDAHIVIVAIMTPALHDNLIWLLFLLRTLQETKPQKITVFMPYAPYARQSGALQSILSMLEALGVSTFVAGQLHESSYIPKERLLVNNITLDDHIAQWVAKRYPQGQVTIIAPDQGSAERSQAVAQHINAPLIVCTKDRYAVNTVRITKIDGVCQTPYALIIDDIIDTGSTIRGVARILYERHNLCTIDVFAVHGLLSGTAQELLQQSSLRAVVITNTIEHDRLSAQFEVVDFSDEVVSRVIKLLKY